MAATSAYNTTPSPPATVDCFASTSPGWLGHSLQLASVYMPNTPSEQKAFITERLKPVATCEEARYRTCLWGGDFNFNF